MKMFDFMCVFYFRSNSAADFILHVNVYFRETLIILSDTLQNILW